MSPLKNRLAGFTALLLFAVLCQAADFPRLEEAWRLENGLARPESVVYDKVDNVLYVSSINGGGTERDKNGYISKVAIDGTLLEEKWATGLHGPKGMAIYEDTLFVSDVDALVAIDRATGLVTRRFTVKEPVFLNDVAVDGLGRAYMSDSGNSIVYRLQNGQLQPWLDSEMSRNTNGVYTGNKYMIIAAGDTSAENPGASRYLKKVDYHSREIEPLFDNKPLGSIDAVEADGKQGFFLSDWPAGVVLYLDKNGTSRVILKAGKGSADLTIIADTDMLYLPMMEDNQLVAYRIIR